jgi:transposase
MSTTAPSSAPSPRNSLPITGNWPNPAITLVFDKGNNSEEAFESLQNTPFHFVGSLVPSQHSELLGISRRQFRTISQAGLERVEIYRTQKKVFGQARTIVVTFNQNLYDGQLQGLATHLGKARLLSNSLTAGITG